MRSDEWRSKDDCITSCALMLNLRGSNCSSLAKGMRARHELKLMSFPPERGGETIICARARPRHNKLAPTMLRNCSLTDRPLNITDYGPHRTNSQLIPHINPTSRDHPALAEGRTPQEEHSELSCPSSDNSKTKSVSTPVLILKRQKVAVQN